MADIIIKKPEDWKLVKAGDKVIVHEKEIAKPGNYETRSEAEAKAKAEKPQE
jgi:hypothetical protein